jgi:acetamidase/formamidase
MTPVQPLRLGREAIHTYWDNSLSPRLTVAPGEVCIIETREPSQGHVAREVTAAGSTGIQAELAALIAEAASHPAATGTGTELGGHALTGPIHILGAEPGDTLLVEILEVQPASWGWTACGPGEDGGLLHDELAEWDLHVWDLRSGATAAFGPGIHVRLAPFCGVMGVAPAEPGRHRTAPPRRTGGNLDLRQATAGSTLALPVDLPGALFSIGDAHAAQGDGEVGGTGIEMDATVTLRFNLVKGKTVPSPQLRIPMLTQIAGPWFATTGHDADLYQAARQALRGILQYLDENYGMPRSQACILASVCVDLRISQIVNGGIYTVSAFLPLSIFDR